MLRVVAPVFLLMLSGSTTAFAETWAPQAQQSNRRRAWLDQHPDDVDARVELGRSMLAEGRVPAAIDELQDALNRDATHVEAHVLLALAVQDQRPPDLVRAETLLERAIALAPDHANAQVSLGQVYQARGRLEQALAAFDRAIALSHQPDILLTAHLGRMAVFEAQQKPALAQAELARARAIYPGVDELLKDAEIARAMPAPEYGGEEFHDKASPTHPSLEERTKRAQAMLRHMGIE